jgi:hypothetical protein
VASELNEKRAATQEARKILVRQIEKAVAPLKVKRASDSSVHSARKQIKKARATLRLLAKVSRGNAIARRMNACGMLPSL